MSRTYRVVLRPQARRDLAEIGAYIAKEASQSIALRYIARLREACLVLQRFPARGTERSDLFPGLRIIGFERRATIAFVVEADTVRILDIFYGRPRFRGRAQEGVRRPRLTPPPP